MENKPARCAVRIDLLGYALEANAALEKCGHDLLPVRQTAPESPHHVGVTFAQVLSIEHE